MIPFAIPAVLARVPWKLVGAGLAAFVLFVLLIRINVWHDAHKALPGVQAALEAEQACADGSQCKARQIALQEVADRERERIESDYLRDLEALRARPPAPSVRVCRPAGAGHVPSAGPARPADGTAPGGELPVEVSDDIGQRLFDLADEADREALKLRHLQQWNQALSTQPNK